MAIKYLLIFKFKNMKAKIIYLVIEIVHDGTGILNIKNSYKLKADAIQYIGENPYSNFIIQELKLL